MRVALFPGVPVTAVLSAEKARPILDQIRSSLAAIEGGLDVLDINLEPMEDLEGREAQVSEPDPLEVSRQTDRDSLVLGSGLSNEDSFSGFSGASASGHEIVSQQTEKTAHSLKKSQQRSKTEKDTKSS